MAYDALAVGQFNNQPLPGQDNFIGPVQKPIPGVSSAVSTAAYNAGYSSTNKIDNTKISGSPAIPMTVNLGNAMKNAGNGVLQPVPTYGSDVKDAQGKIVGKAMFDPNTGKALEDPNSKKFDSTTGNPLNQPAPDPNAGKVSVADPVTGNNILVDSALAPSYQQAQSAVDLTNQQYQSDLAAKRAALQANIDKLNTDKDNAMAAAETSYRTNNPEGSGSDMEQYKAGVGSKYDKAISEATFDMNTQLTNLDISHKANLQNIQNQLTSAVQTNTANIQQAKKDASSILNTSIDNFQKIITGNPDIMKLFNDAGEMTGSYDSVQTFLETARGMGVPQDLALPMMKAEVANSKAKQAALDSKAASDELAQRKQNALEQHQAASDNRANAMLSLALNRDQRADENSARQEVKQIESDFLKSNTASQSLSVGQQYLARIEAASGEGVSALGLIDALVKLDTGGQAVRQGQTDILQESGTWGDAASRLMAKAGLSSKTGANTILTPNQVAQIKTQARKIAKEQIAAALPAYVEAKEGVDSIKNQYPSESQKIEGYSSQLKSAEKFISTYGSAEDKKAAGVDSKSSTENTNAPASGQITMFKGRQYKSDGTQWVLVE